MTTFHPYSDHPYETETFWVSFHDPAREARRLVLQPGAVQPGDLQRRGLCVGRVARAPLYAGTARELPLVEPDAMDLRDIELPNGNRIQMLEPLTRYRVQRDEPEKFEADTPRPVGVWTAVEVSGPQLNVAAALRAARVRT